MKKLLPLLFMGLILIGCGKKKNTPVPILPPAKAVLSTPSQNAVCTTGTVLSDTESSILFTWNTADNAGNYDLVLKNLLTSDTTTQNTNQTQLTLTLLRNTPYSWYIVSKSDKTSATAKSDVWKFYNSGPGVVTYAPFPAEIISPTFGQQVTASSGTINLSWTGNSVDNATLVYDVYFGTSNSPVILKSNLTDMFLNNVTVISGTTYYWRIITKDPNGNTSDSGLFQFSVQ
jgi:hypothetical protein